MDGKFSSEIGWSSFFHKMVRGESPRATVQVSVVRSPCCKFEGARNGTTLGATVNEQISLENSNTLKFKRNKRCGYFYNYGLK